MMKSALFTTAAAAGAVGAGLPPHAWPFFAGSPERTSILVGEPAPGGQTLNFVAWTVSRDESGASISFLGQAGIVASRDHVYAIAQRLPNGHSNVYILAAVDRRAGRTVWSRQIEPPVSESISAPAYDESRGEVIVASGERLAAFDAVSGAPKWTTPLDGPVVNASPVVTDSLSVSNRCFITEFDGEGEDGRLTCVNVDPFSFASNPFEPGEILWSAPIGGSSGNSPAFRDGVVYITSVGTEGIGRIQAFNARATSEPAPLWTALNPEPEGFFGGVCVVDDPTGDGAALYAASYAFWGGRLSANLVKVDAATGAIRWTTACNRTATTPVVLPEGVIALSGGIHGFGTVPTVQLFRDHGFGASLAWDSALDTWNDLDHDGKFDPGEYLVAGGWTIQPAATLDGRTLFVGAMPVGGSTQVPPQTILAIDLRKLPEPIGGPAPDRLLAQAAGAGGSPALADQNVYSVGPGGLRAFGVPPECFDVDGNGRFDHNDLLAWESAVGRLDVNLDGVVTSADLDALDGALRAIDGGQAGQGRD